MKANKISLFLCILLSAGVLSACGSSSSSNVSSITTSSETTSSDGSSSSTDVSSSTTSSTSETPYIEDDLINMKGTFTNSGTTYTATDERSALLFDNRYNEYFISGTLETSNKNKRHGLIFNYNFNSRTYYLFGYNANAELEITYFNGEETTVEVPLHEYKYTTASKLSISGDNTSLIYEFFVNDKQVYSTNHGFIFGEQVGLLAIDKGAKFSSVVSNNDPDWLTSQFSNYSIPHGSFSIKDNIATVTAANSMLVHKTLTFTTGRLDVTLNVTDKLSGNMGIVFGLNDNGKEKYYREDGISYYYLVLTRMYGLCLYTIVGTTATALKTKYTSDLDYTIDHTISVERNNEQLFIYLDGALRFSYIEQGVMTGNKFGVFTSVNMGCYKHISMHQLPAEEEQISDEYDVVSGNFYKYYGKTIAKSGKSMLVAKNPAPANATIEAEVAITETYDAGLIFKLNKPENSKYYETEMGLSYYWLKVYSDGRATFVRFKDGVAKTEVNKFINGGLGLAGTMKIVMDDDDIYAYYSGILVFHYKDSNPLTGNYYGFKAQKGSLFQGNIEVSEQHTKETYDYLIFGHSYTQLWGQYRDDFAELGTSIHNVGLGGAQTGSLALYINELAAFESEWGICWNGINDIDADVATSKIASNMENTLTGVKAINPKFKCVVISNNRCTSAKPEARRSKISEVNAEYKKICDKYDWLVYLDVELLFCDANGNPIDGYFIDKLHPNRTAYGMVSKLVINKIKAYK